MIKTPFSIGKVVAGANQLSLGISMVVAILLGIAAGWGLREWTGVGWLFWVGVFWGVAAALLNVYKVYQQQLKEYEEVAKNPKYAYKNQPKDDEWDED